MKAYNHATKVAHCAAFRYGAQPRLSHLNTGLLTQRVAALSPERGGQD